MRSRQPSSAGRPYVPEVAPLVPLARLLSSWDPARRLMWCDEIRCRRRARAGRAFRRRLSPVPWAILIGPEGGFSQKDERQRLRALPFVPPVTLGPRILRADTAAVAALTLWQAHRGDWR